jgi:hypothetical protein
VALVLPNSETRKIRRKRWICLAQFPHGFANYVQLLGLGIAQGTQKNAIYHRKNDRGGSNAERQRDHGNGCEQRILSQLP